MANLKKINIGGTSYDIVDNGGRLLIGTTAELKTNVKTDLVVAINEVFDAVGTGGTNAVVTVEKSTDGLVYTLKQGGSEIGVINIPKDMVVNGGSYADGNLTLNIANGDPVVIPVADLIDLYTGGSNTEIAVDVNSENVISATLVDGGITTAKIADNAIVTGKIADKNVTKAKLEQGVQDSLALADSAYQKPSTGVALTDLASGVQTSLGKADSAYQLPTGGVPKTDLASAVQTSLGKADSAYQKPTTGIGTSDLASGVVTSLGKADTAYQKPTAGIGTDDLASGVTASLGKANSSVQSITQGSNVNVKDNGGKNYTISVSSSSIQEGADGFVKASNAKEYIGEVQTGLQNQITAIANGTDNNFKAVETRFGTNEANINRALTATKETFVYDSATETLTITSSAV